MSIDLLGVYESRINKRLVKIYRDKNNVSLGRLYINGAFMGVAPFYYTVKRMISMEDKGFPVYRSNLSHKASIC